MSGRTYLGMSVFQAAVARCAEQYAAGHRLVVSSSGGKDSAVTLEVAILAATQTGRLPVEVVMRDEEILFPGTFDYLERVAARPEVSMRWVVAHQPILNAFDRERPYWWVFDPEVDRELWVRQPPDWAEEIPDMNIQALVSPGYYPPPPGKELHCVMGLRGQESRNRMMGIHSSGGYLTKPNFLGVRNLRPVYDWTDADVWLAIHKFGWDYNAAYDVMHRLGINRRDLRISPPTMNPAGGDMLGIAAGAWPEWWNRVTRRLPSTRTYALYGKRAVQAQRRSDETWEQCFFRTCVDTAPAWIAARASEQADKTVRRHLRHSTAPLPQAGKCLQCGTLGSWRVLAMSMYLGDPFSQRAQLPYVEPEFFRPGAGRWNGSPSF